VEGAPFAWHNDLRYIITKHPKVMSTISTALILAGSIVLLPGVSTYAGDTILAHPVVKIGGGIAIAAGKWLRTTVSSAEGVAQAEPRGQEAI